MIEVQLALPESVFSVTRGTPDEFVQEIRLAAAVKWYEIPFQTTTEELKAEVARG